MKNGAAYAKKLKTAYRKVRGSAGDDAAATEGDPVAQLILAVFAESVGVARARQAVAALQAVMVDYNELRVSSPGEVADPVGGQVPKSVGAAKTLLRILNGIYQREYAVSLDGLSGKGVRETKAYLDTLGGMTPFVSAFVRQWGYKAHAIPVSEPALAWLRDQDWVDPDAAVADVQSFLERHVSAADGRQFCLDLEAQTGRKSTAKAKSVAKSATKSKSTRSAKSRSTARTAKATHRSKKNTRKPAENRRKKKVSTRSGR